jgi:hypothetical protein
MEISVERKACFTVKYNTGHRLAKDGRVALVLF